MTSGRCNSTEVPGRPTTHRGSELKKRRPGFSCPNHGLTPDRTTSVPMLPGPKEQGRPLRCELVCTHKTFTKGRSIFRRSTENGPGRPSSIVSRATTFTGELPALFLPTKPVGQHDVAIGMATERSVATRLEDSPMNSRRPVFEPSATDRAAYHHP